MSVFIFCKESPTLAAKILRMHAFACVYLEPIIWWKHFGRRAANLPTDTVRDRLLPFYAAHIKHSITGRLTWILMAILVTGTAEN
ncbi:unnamed protein product [Protopolystoma xenopodis]|uniref:Uncharacterized protein n=1 Tax=Protopolystoma xenopodis TaxID=117903 RepID=A0A3S5AYS5_9PLAT|nr:unnamed protein product [Protopolystoma xenopodis]